MDNLLALVIYIIGLMLLLILAAMAWSVFIITMPILICISICGWFLDKLKVDWRHWINNK